MSRAVRTNATARATAYRQAPVSPAINPRTGLTRVPRSVTIQRLPYAGPGGDPARLAPAYPYRVFIPIDGVDVAVGRRFKTLERAVARAKKLSESSPYAVVRVGQRHLSVCKRGRELANLSELPSLA